MTVRDVTPAGRTMGGSAALLYSLIWRAGSISRGELVQRTGLTKSTVSINVDELLSRGLVNETGFLPSGLEGGRRAKLLEVNPASHVVAGIHLGVRQTRVVIANALGEELAVRELPTGRRSPEQTLTGLGRLVHELCAELEVPLDRLTAVGVALPGVVDQATGVCRVAPNLGWRDLAVASILQDVVGVAVHLNNTTQAMAVAEAHDALGRGESGDLTLLYLGTGVGSASVNGGRLFRGSNGFAGEIGHVAMGSEIECSCGNRGCLETLVSGPAIARRAAELGLGGPRGRISTPELLGQAALAGDSAARALLSTVGQELGEAAAWLVQVSNPRTLVVAGGVSELGDLLLDPLRQTLRERTMPGVYESLLVRRSLLDRRGKLRGAVLVALGQLEDPAEQLSAVSR
ncbi:MAG: ROK family transcriptional regulator [Propionicimonas sp.]